MFMATTAGLKHQRSAMGEDSKIQILSNDLIRRLSNCGLDIGAKKKRRIVDKYGQKLFNID